jgi:hypothetical protein
LAASSPDFGTRRGRNDWTAAISMTLSVPNKNSTRATADSESSSSAQSAGITSSVAARRTFDQTMIGLRRIRSTRAPMTSPSSRYGSSCTALINPTSVALASRTETTST